MVAVTAIMAVELGGCANWFGNSTRHSAQTTPPATHYQASHEAAYQILHESRKEGLKPVSKPTYDEAAAAVAGVPPLPRPRAIVPLPAPKPTVTLGNDDAIKSRAERLLSATDAKLAGVDRSSLNPQNAVTYEQAAGFANAARQAFEEQDYVAASGFAQKASLLAEKVATIRSTK